MKPFIAAVSLSMVAAALIAGCSSNPDPQPQESAAVTPAKGSGAGCHSGGGEGSGAGGGCRKGGASQGEGSGGGCCRVSTGAAPAPAAAPAEEEILVGLPEGLDKPGYQRIVTMSGGRNVLVWKTEDGYGAASATCTHMGGTLRYNHTEKRLECPIHGSRFRLDGSIINGPAEKKLLVYRAEVREGKLHLFPLPMKE